MKDATEEKEVRHPIRFKIFLVSLVPTLALLAAAILNNQYLSRLGESAELILSKNYRSIRAAQESRKSLEQIRNILLEGVLQQEPVRIPGALLDRLADNLAICRQNITEAGEGQVIDRLVASHGRYRLLVEAADEAGGRWRLDERFSAFLTATAEMVAILDDLVILNETAMEQSEQRIRGLAVRAQRNAAILFGIIVAAILALSYFLSYRIARPIMTLAQSLSSAKEGSGAYPMVEPSSNDEIGFLTEAFNRLFTRLEVHDRYRDDILAAEKEKVRSGEEAKGRFIAEISHQLKTPMTSLAMGVGMLHERGQGLDAATRETLVATAHDDCARMAALINELVDVSRLEAMSSPRPKETLDVAVVIRESLAPLQKQARDKGVCLEIDIQADVPRITIDSFRFPWVITNLVGNALRYTEAGGCIRLKAYRRGLKCCFECSDTGSGIDPAFLPRIFDRYTQFSERGKSGTIGLGLAIVKEIIEQHGGDVEVQSRPGRGTTFVFWVPAAKEANA